MNKQQIKEKDIKISRFMSLILRHKPEVIGCKLDREGWIKTSSLIKGMQNKGEDVTFNDIERIVKEDDKGRYAFNFDKTRIRARQGHSIKVDLNLKPQIPPTILFHGTGKKYVDSIFDKGIKSKQREFVHLSDELDTAIKVGSRHGEVFVLEIDTEKMIKDGYKFFKSENGVWLTKKVPLGYFRAKGNL